MNQLIQRHGLWYYKVVGESKCPIVDTWWQTETGGILISPQPGAIDLEAWISNKTFLWNQACYC